MSVEPIQTIEPQKAIARRAEPKAAFRAGGAVLAIIPQDIDQVWRMAGLAVAGKMAPKSLVESKSFEEAQSACAIAIMAGAELGLTPLMALRSYAVINGRPALWGDGIKAVVRQSGLCEFIRTGSNADAGWCEAKRTDTGETKRVEFTAIQAKAAGLSTKKGPWSEGYADVMMERRATNRCLNDLFADVLGGVVDAQEAMDDGPVDDEPQQVIAPPPPAEPEHVEDATDIEPFDQGKYMEDLTEAMNLAATEELLMEAWDASDVQSVLTHDEAALQRMFDARAARIQAIDAADALRKQGVLGTAG